MAETKRMTTEEVVGYLLEGEGLDFLRESLSWVVQQLMEAEVSELVGAERGERSPEERLTHRNGYRARRWDTRAGELELAIPKLRRGSYFPSFLEPRRRSEQALVSVVQEAYVAGVSTRKVDQVVESLGLRISRSEASRICAGLDEQVDAFRNRVGCVNSSCLQIRHFARSNPIYAPHTLNAAARVHRCDLLGGLIHEYEAARICEPYGHLERVLRVYLDHYNRERPHRALELRPPEPDERRDISLVCEAHRRDRLGGLIHEYCRAAA
jgi:hypothetical protein